MAPNAFDQLMQEARDAGVDPQWVERVEAATAGSPLRKEKDALAEQLREATEQAGRYRQAALASQFASLKIAVKPDALNIPADLDPLDNEKVRDWAVDMGLAAPPDPAVTQEQQQAHQQFEQAAAGGTPARPPSREDLYAQAKTPEEVMAIARANGVPTTVEMQ